MSHLWTIGNNTDLRVNLIYSKILRPYGGKTLLSLCYHLKPLLIAFCIVRMMNIEYINQEEYNALSDEAKADVDSIKNSGINVDVARRVINKDNVCICGVKAHATLLAASYNGGGYYRRCKNDDCDVTGIVCVSISSYDHWNNNPRHHYGD